MDLLGATRFSILGCLKGNIVGLVQERHNSIANALESCLSCTNPSIWKLTWGQLLFMGGQHEFSYHVAHPVTTFYKMLWQRVPWCTWQDNCKPFRACCYIYFASPLSSWGPSTFHIQHPDETSSQQTTASQGKWMVSGNVFSLSFFFSLPGSGKPGRPGKITFFGKS